MLLIHKQRESRLVSSLWETIWRSDLDLLCLSLVHLSFILGTKLELPNEHFPFQLLDLYLWTWLAAIDHSLDDCASTFTLQ
jgi:hypothetical protein